MAKYSEGSWHRWQCAAMEKAVGGVARSRQRLTTAALRRERCSRLRLMPALFFTAEVTATDGGV